MQIGWPHHVVLLNGRRHVSTVIRPEFEYVDRSTDAIRYLEHGWPHEWCRWHSHPEYELHLMATTHGQAFIGDYIGEYQAGDLFLTGPNLAHHWSTFEAAYPEPVEVRDVLIQFSQDSIDLLTKAFPEFGELAPMWKLARSGIKFEGFDPGFAHNHMQRIRNTRGAERISAFIRFLVRINEHAEKRGLSVLHGRPEDNAKHARIAKLVEHIAQNYSENISLGEAADKVGMSYATFAHSFRKTTGHTFVEFVNRIRVGQACSKLYTTDDPISSICYDVGFQNLANFNRQFMKMKRQTPSAYREHARTRLLRDRKVAP
jgi:AraC-like DNA-binding protein